MSRQNFYKLEKFFKGAANHRRLEMLLLLKKEPNLSTDQIVERLIINYQTGTEHIRRLTDSGLIQSFRKGNTKLHKITPAAEPIIKLLLKP
jgi:predicted transcriptional regulator